MWLKSTDALDSRRQRWTRIYLVQVEGRGDCLSWYCAGSSSWPPDLPWNEWPRNALLTERERCCWQECSSRRMDDSWRSVLCSFCVKGGYRGIRRCWFNQLVSLAEASVTGKCCGPATCVLRTTTVWKRKLSTQEEGQEVDRMRWG